MSVRGNDDTIATQPGTDGGQLDGELVAGRYRIVRWLGAGGMGRVYEALDTELGERVALKVLRGALSDDAIERFRREVKLTRRIQHRNVARMFDIGEHQRDKFLTMELIDGAPLTDQLGEAMAWPALRSLAIQLCAGLAAAHDAGVVHRDLKPDNVMIERGTGRAVITDFGIARSGDDVAVTQIGALIGTPRYMAPEQLAGEAVDHRADVFALGVMLYELATGIRPWSGDSAVVIAIAQAMEPPRPFAAPHVPPAFATLLERCIALDRNQRPVSAAIVGETIAVATTAVSPEDPVELVLDDAAALAMDTTMVAEAPRATRLGAAAPPARAVLAPLPPFAPPRIDPMDPTKVAVLPVTCAPGDEYLADGLLDDLIDTLSSTGTLRVRPAGAVRARTEPDPRALGAALEVDHIVACALRRMPLGLRVTARLIGVADGFQIWARREDCTEAEILLVAERLGRGIATALSARATGGDRPTDPRAVELYLRARAELRRFWADHTQNAVDLLEQAAACADSPPILGALAYATVQAWIMRGEPALAQRAQEAIDRGLPSGHGEAFLASATFKLNQGDLEGAVSALGQALVRAPMSAPAHEAAGKLLIEINARSEGRFHLETALALDPGRASVIGVDLGRLDALEGNWASATAHYRRLLDDADPSVVQIGAVFAARLAGWRNDRPAMVEAVSRFAPRVESDALLLAFFKQVMSQGQLDVAQWTQLDQRFTRRDRPQRMQVLGLQLMTEIAILLGHDDLAIRALARATDLGLIDITWLDSCPLFAPLTVDLRWIAIRDAVAQRAARVLAAFRAAAG